MINSAKFPKKLKQGDTIGIAATSSFLSSKRAEECAKAIKKLGYKVKAASNLDANYGGYMAGSGKERARQLNKMFADREVDAIICVRGGDGSSRMMEYLDYDLIRENPKIFVGYSDVTNLHLALPKRCNLVTFHGPMVSSNMVDDFDDETKKSFFNMINADSEFSFSNPKGFDIKILREGKARGRLIGGNLSLLSASIGTPYEVETEDNILFIEEVSEPVSKIEKWAFHLRNSGKLKKCSGIILGQFTNITNSGCMEFGAVRCMAEAFEGLDIPIMYNIQSGHGKPMMTLPVGARCRMDTLSKSIIFEVERVDTTGNTW